jgi:adenine phosphoribosyltransferase
LVDAGLFRESLEAARVMQRGGYSYFIHSLTDSIPPINPGLLSEVCDRIMAVGDFDSDQILTMEAMGIHIGALLSVRTGLPLNIIRKRGYGVEGEMVLGQETGYSRGSMYVNNIRGADVITIVDAVISTGGTLCATLDAVCSRGAIVKDIICAIERGDGVKKVFDNTGFKVKTLARIDVTDRVEILKMTD